MPGGGESQAGPAVATRRLLRPRHPGSGRNDSDAPAPRRAPRDRPRARATRVPRPSLPARRAGARASAARALRERHRLRPAPAPRRRAATRRGRRAPRPPERHVAPVGPHRIGRAARLSLGVAGLVAPCAAVARRPPACAGTLAHASARRAPRDARGLRADRRGPLGAAVSGIRCVTCGTAIPVDARFCPFDGAPVTEGSQPSHRATPLPQAFQVGPYECVEPLGEGGMGVVYRARHTAPRAHRGGEGAAPRHGPRRVARGALSTRGEARRERAAPQLRGHLRLRRAPGRDALPRDGARRGAQPRRRHRSPPHGARARLAHRAADRRRARRGAPRGGRAPRPQARQRDARAGSQRRAREDRRLRHRPRGHGSAAHRGRSRHGHARVHGAGAGPRRRGPRRPRRRLRPRRGRVRDAHRRAALRRPRLGLSRRAHAAHGARWPRAVCARSGDLPAGRGG